MYDKHRGTSRDDFGSIIFFLYHQCLSCLHVPNGNVHTAHLDVTEDGKGGFFRRTSSASATMLSARLGVMCWISRYRAPKTRLVTSRPEGARCSQGMERALAANRDLQRCLRLQLESVDEALRDLEETVAKTIALSTTTTKSDDDAEEEEVEAISPSSSVKKVPSVDETRNSKPLPTQNWTKEEEQRLLVSVDAHLGHHWESISSVVETKPALECLVHYQRALNRELLRSHWTAEEDALLLETCEKLGTSDWQAIASELPGRTKTQCRERMIKSLAATSKGKWSPEEERRLILAVRAYGTDWRRLTPHVPTRTDAQCREKWVNVLDPSVNRIADWTPEQDQQLKELVGKFGMRWATIAKHLANHRTDSQCYRRYRQLGGTEGAATTARAVKTAALPKLTSRTGEQSNLSKLDNTDFKIVLADSA